MQWGPAHCGGVSNDHDRALRADCRVLAGPAAVRQALIEQFTDVTT